MNRRILIFHSHIWRNYFRDLATHLTREEGCALAVVSHAPEKHHWRHLLADGHRHFTLPDLRKPQPFESTPDGRKRLEGRISTCEKLAGKSATRTLLSAERDMGRGFSRDFFIWPDSPLGRWCRSDAENPRLALLRLFDFLASIFDAFQPDVVITRSISEFSSLAAWFLAQERGIPVLSCRFSKLASKKSFWTDDFHMYNTEADERFRQLETNGVQPDPLYVSRIDAFREQPQTVDYIQQNWKLLQDRTFGSQLRQLAQVFRENLRYYRTGRIGQRQSSVLDLTGFLLCRGLRSRLHAHFFQTLAETELAPARYVYIALHKEPELMLNFESPLWHDQRNLVKYVASMLPAGFRLLVKEHRFNWGRRTAQYLRFLSGLPSVTLIHPFDDQFKYLKHASLVITDNGSTGWEGLLLRKPIITLEKTLYDAPGLTRQVFDPRTLDRAMLEALSEPTPVAPEEYSHKLALRLQAEEETTMLIDEMHRDMNLSVQAIERLLQRNPA